MLTISMDNASVNEVFAATLSNLLLQHYKIKFVPDNGYIHCLDHIGSLVVQSFMNALDEAEDPSANDYYGSNKKYPIHYDEDQDEVLLEFEAEMEKELDRLELHNVVDKIGEAADDGLLEQMLEDIESWSPVKKASYRDQFKSHY